MNTIRSQRIGRWIWVIVAAAIGLLPGMLRAEPEGHASAEENAAPAFSFNLHHQDASSTEPAQSDATERQVGVEERLGEFIDLTLTFRDEKGRALRLADFIEKPTLLLPVYYYCPQACSMMLANLASAVNDVPLTPGETYQILAVSFDAEETPELAKEAKNNYWPIIQKDFPEQQWRFLTGPQRQIDALLAGLGYRIKKTGPHTFIHPNALIVISPRGRIIRYLYGVYFLPFDIGMALTEASKGTPQLSIRRVLSYCFDYDSQKKTYVFNAFRISAVTIVLMLAVFLFFLLRKGNRRGRGTERNGRGNPQ